MWGVSDCIKSLNSETLMRTAHRAQTHTSTFSVGAYRRACESRTGELGGLICKYTPKPLPQRDGRRGRNNGARWGFAARASLLLRDAVGGAQSRHLIHRHVPFRWCASLRLSPSLWFVVWNLFWLLQLQADADATTTLIEFYSTKYKSSAPLPG